MILEENVKIPMGSTKDKHRSNERSRLSTNIGQLKEKTTGCLHWSHREALDHCINIIQGKAGGK